MRASFYQQQWQGLQDSTDAAAIESLGRRIASTFMDRYYYSDEYDRDYIRLLCEMATHYEDQSLNRLTAGILFGIVVERLCDDFEELQTETYNRLICQVVHFLCELPGGRELDAELQGFGLRGEKLLYQRIESMRIDADRVISRNFQPRKVLVLSRVTIGADVAITSVICQRVARRWPEAQLAVVGDAKLQQVFGAESGVRVCELRYSRRGALLERFLAWLKLLQLLRREVSGLGATEYLVLDPDSRLTQLGVLPVAPPANYRLFNSRGKKDYSPRAPVSELVNLWLNEILEENDYCPPRVWPEAHDLQRARQLREVLDPHHDLTIVAVNFGVGGNPRKQVSDDFEAELVLELLRDPQTKVILDPGLGEEEEQRSNAVLAVADHEGIATQEMEFADLGQVRRNSRLVKVRCSVGEVTALIASSDEFIGYDSACRHIAAAQGVRTFSIFAGTNNARFIRRWHASGPGKHEIIYVDTISRHKTIDNQEIIARLQDLRRA